MWLKSETTPTLNMYVMSNTNIFLKTEIFSCFCASYMPTEFLVTKAKVLKMLPKVNI